MTNRVVNVQPRASEAISPLRRQAKRITTEFLKEFHSRVDKSYAQLKASNTLVDQDEKIKDIIVNTYIQTFKEHYQTQENLVNNNEFIERNAKSASEKYLKKKREQENSCCIIS